MHPVLALPLWANMSVYKTEALTQWIGWVLFSESRVLYHYITIGGSYKLSPLQIDIMLAILFDLHLSPLNVCFHSPIYGEIM